MATQTARMQRGGEMPRAYDPRAVEGRIYAFWEANGYFIPSVPPEDWQRGNGGPEPFTIIMPPPNVTGELHLGHALTAAIEDGLSRWHRMLGDPTLWLPGTDHAGIATQIVVERELAKEGMTRQDLGRDAFVERVWMWVRKTRRRIDDQHRRLGASCDWSRNRFTMDETPQLAVRTTFKRLYDDGLIYRGTRIINWCPRCQTALSDLEVDHQEHAGSLYHIKYPLIDANGVETGRYVQMATTRPETIVGDTAVAVNPEDERWQDVIGERARLPIIGREIPIVADAEVDPAFGTGAVKVTPGHDPTDYEIGLRHGLPIVNVMNPDATMNAEAGPYDGLDRYEARRRIVDDFDNAGLLVKIEEYTTSIGHCDRCDTVVEPIVSPQWYVKMEPLAHPAIAAVREGRIRMVPERFEKVYLNWMENIRDWCISRQLWWGHRIPVWYCDACNETIVAVETPTACGKCGGALRQDEDVLDTWFSSGLWTHSTLGWPKQTRDLDFFYPTSVMETGWDILFFWVARMIVLGLYNMGREPFHTVYLHGMVRDENGDKMSKMKGNVIDPLLMIDEYGADALRYSLVTAGSAGNDLRFSRERIEAAQHFCNKLWNAARFVIQKLGGEPVAALEPAARAALPLEDRWILSRLDGLAADVNQYLGSFQLGEAARRIYDFLWNEYCDWYIEAAKVRLNAGDGSPLPVLAHVLAGGLKLLHPFAPFVTEEIWQNLLPDLPAGESPALIVAPYPAATGAWRDAEAERTMEALIDAVRAIRNLRAEKKIDPARWVEALIGAESDALRHAFSARGAVAETLARARPLMIVHPGALPAANVARTVLEWGSVVLPLAGLVDTEAERARLQKELDGEEANVTRIEAQLPKMRGRAPEHVIAKMEEGLSASQAKIAALRASLDTLEP
ncbi:MAG TPA: valine--tRNA ligase [Dehalococcoidia bacterium]|nr:valine--tRNA ligase [Dehalococcoidia bacterium]